VFIVRVVIFLIALSFSRDSNKRELNLELTDPWQITLDEDFLKWPANYGNNVTFSELYRVEMDAIPEMLKLHHLQKEVPRDYYLYMEMYGVCQKIVEILMGYDKSRSYQFYELRNHYRRRAEEIKRKEEKWDKLKKKEIILNEDLIYASFMCIL